MNIRTVTLLACLISPMSFAGTLYSTPSCSACAAARVVLDSNCISYKVETITRDNNYGILRVPVYDTGLQRLEGLYEISKWAEKNSNCN